MDIKRMSYKELLLYKESIDKQQTAIAERLNQIGDNILILKQEQIPFKKYSLSERQKLYNINPKAYDYMTSNSDTNIEDYNATHLIDKVEVLYK